MNLKSFGTGVYNYVGRPALLGAAGAAVGSYVSSTDEASQMRGKITGGLVGAGTALGYHGMSKLASRFFNKAKPIVEKGVASAKAGVAEVKEMAGVAADTVRSVT